jgi:hypothetical protein
MALMNRQGETPGVLDETLPKVTIHGAPQLREVVTAQNDAIERDSCDSISSTVGLAPNTSPSSSKWVYASSTKVHRGSAKRSSAASVDLPVA